MIILITCREYDEVDCKYDVYVSHGIDTDTDKTVILPSDTLNYYRMTGMAEYNQEIGEYILVQSPKM